MHFKHPELLYFLGLLVIPIIIHLFQWRKFKVEYFTNVKLLQKLSIQTRKSSKLKKYLLLFTRCLLFLALIFAFAKPFFKAKDSTNEQNKLYVVLDNSHSMQAKGKTGELMLSAVNQLILETPENYEISILTNDDAYWNTNVKTIRTQLLETNYSPNAFNLNQAINKIKAQKDSNKKDILVLTDNVNQKIENLKNNDNFQFFYKEYEAEKTSNVAIDSVFLSNTLDNFYEVSVVLKNYGEYQENIPLVIYNNEKVVAKSIENFNFKEKTLKFNLPKESINARINIEDNSLSYDNDYYFNIKSPKKTNILNIGNVSKSLHFNRIFVPQEFNFNSIEESSINASFFENNSVIILNEIKNLDKNLQKQVLIFLENGGNLIFIPSVENDLKTLNDFFGSLNINWQKSKNSNLKITNISFDHPLYQNVFEKKITNFVYPSCKESFVLKNSSPTILEYENGTAFLKGIKKNNGMLYVFAGAISEPNSNFKNSQLIVPTLYNMTRNNETTGFSALNIGQESPYFLDLKLNKEEIVSIGKEGEKYIPNQQIIQNKVKLNFYDEPKKAGNYQVFLENKAVDNISFNYPKSESNLLLKDGNNYNDFEEISSLNTFFNDLKTNRSNTSYWKFFVVLALLCILAEVLIQKFVK
jgi:hypothetical protein